MLTLTTIAGVRSRRRELYQKGISLGLVPTMGALHAGHFSLVRRARELADEVWASVFVNPTQFGAGEDFERYPRDLEADAAALAAAGVSVLFAPGTKEMYPKSPATAITLPGPAAGLCGAQRPGHFNGVALVVAKLFNIVQPEVAVFGAKDWQQAAIIRRMVADLDFPVRIEVAPTIREDDGLAMSSRNAYLSADQRRGAVILRRALTAAEAAVRAGERDAGRLEALMAHEIGREPLARLQYVAAVHPDTLEPLTPLADRVLLAVAVLFGSTRLIDNLLVEVPQC